jgi:hypothetical protein
MYGMGSHAMESMLPSGTLSVLVLRFSICRRKPQYQLNTACPDASCLRNCPIASITLGRLEIERDVGACAAAKHIGTVAAGQDILASTAA